MRVIPSHYATVGLLAAAVAVFALSEPGAGGASSDAVALVDGVPITRAAFGQEMRVASAAHEQGVPSLAARPLVPPQFAACVARGRAKEAAIGREPSNSELRSACRATYRQLRATAMSFLVRGAWVVAEARNLGIHLAAAQIDGEYARLKARQFPRADAFAAFLKTSGETVAELHYRVMLGLLREKIEEKVELTAPQPTSAAIAEYFAANGTRFTTVAGRDALMIRVTSRSAAAMVKARIRNGMSFAVAAHRYSLDRRTKNRGELALSVKQGTEPPALDRAVFSAPPANLEGPVAIPTGYVIFTVQRTIPARPQSLAEATPAIRKLLVETSRQRRLASFNATFAAKWRSRTTCRPAFADPQVC